MTDKEIVYNSLIPELSVSNIDISKKFYLDLGFKIRYERKENKFCLLQLEGNQIMIEENNDNWNTGKLEHPYGRGINLSMTVSNIEKMYEILKEKVKTSCIEIKTPPESVILIALLHDLCKANYYKIDYRNAKNALGVWEKVPYYTVEDTIPYGHGEKSVMMITEYMKLTSEEKYAIRWHMGFTEPKEQYGTIGLAYTKYPLALLMFEADLEATYFFNT